FPGRRRDQPVDGKYMGEQLRQAAELAGIQLERPLHTLRHSYARALRRVEAPLEVVQTAPRPLQPGHHLGVSAPATGPGGSLVAQAGPRAGSGSWGRGDLGGGGAMTAPVAGATLAEELRRRRMALGWTLEQVAERAQVSVGILSLIETSKRRPSLRSWERIREALGIIERLPEEAWRHQPQEISDELVAALGACLAAVRAPTLA